ncbi:MAG TPA: hypothetical protein VFS70_18390, partial [Actinomycetota bacterium]|nr:hypothetical protein [Actinomycetota bacterium]
MQGGAADSAAPVAATELAGGARRARLVVAAVVFAVLLAGTAWGHDDHFPFGPFRMYATRQRLDGTTSWYQLEATTVAGQRIVLPGAAYGLRRAELEGQIPRFLADPRLLGDLASAYEVRRPGGPDLAEVHLVKWRQHLDGGR